MIDASSKPPSPSRHPFSIAALALACVALWAAPARADVPPYCSASDKLITCAAADVGKPCQGGGKCYEIGCSGSKGESSQVYKCDACPTIVASNECDYANIGSACGGGDGGTGTCGVLRFHCAPSGGKFACQKPSTETPTGPPKGGAAGTGGGNVSARKSSGCDVAPSPTSSAIGLGLVVLGFIFVVVERIRRRRRR